MLSMQSCAAMCSARRDTVLQKGIIPTISRSEPSARQAGHQPQVVLMRDAWVAQSRAEAEAVYGPEVMAAYRYYWQNQLAEFRKFRSEAEFTLANVAQDRLILGEPETCVREFHRWHEATGADFFLSAFAPCPLWRTGA